MTVLKILIFSLLIDCCVTNLYSQSVIFPFERYGEEQGLPGSVNKIVQDTMGYLWIGTIDGLVRYDGKRFKCFYNKLGDISSISNNVINDLCVDQFNRIWIATNGGLCYYDYQISKFKRIEIPENLETDDLFRIHCVATDYFGRVWFSTKSGVHVLNHQFSVEKSYYLSSEKESINKSIYIDSLENLFVGTNQSILIRMNLCSGELQTKSIYSKHSREIKSTTTQRVIVPLNDTRLLIGSWLGGLNELFYSHSEFTLNHYDRNQDPDIKSNIVTGITVLNDSCWWVGTFGAGLAVFNPILKQYERYIKHDPGNPRSLGSNYINQIYKDRRGIIWIATVNGISKYDPALHQFSTIATPELQGEISIYRNPYCIIDNLSDTTSKNLLLTIPGSGIFEFDRVTMRFSTPFQKLNIDNPERMFYQMKFLKQDILLTLESSRLYEFDVNKKTFLTLNSGKENEFARARKFIVDKNRNIWVASSSSGVYKYDFQNKNWSRMQHKDGETNTLQDNSVFCLLEDGKGNIWFGTQNKGLSYLDVRTNRFAYFEHNKKDPRSLPDNAVFDLCEDQSGNIWIATENGLARYDTLSKLFKIFTTSEGLPSNNIHSITKDKLDNLWIATNRGLVLFKAQEGVFHIFDQQDGLASNRMDGAAHCSLDGTMFFATNGMISWCQPKNFISNKIPPKTWISNINVYGTDLNINRIQNRIKPLVINYDQNVINLELSALSFSNSAKNKFAYFLEGYDKQWNYSGTMANAIYSNVPGGSYTFIAKSANSDGIWSAASDPLMIIIHPPFWKTWWFYSALFLMIAGLVFLYYKILINQINRLNELRNSIAADLHDEIGSTLSSIQLNLNLLFQSTKANDPQFRLMERIQTASRNAMEMMSEIVWSVQSKNDHLELLISKMRQYAAEILEGAGIEFNFNVDVKTGNRKINLRARKELFLIFKEAVNNLAKYSKATLATISINIENKKFELSIQDNGIGFNLNNSNYGNGLKIMKERSKKINANLKLNSEIGIGTSVEFEILDFT